LKVSLNVDRKSNSSNWKTERVLRSHYRIFSSNVTTVYIYTADIQVMRVTRWIVLPFLPEALYKLGIFEEIVKCGKTIRQISRMIFKVALKRFCMNVTLKKNLGKLMEESLSFKIKSNSKVLNSTCMVKKIIFKTFFNIIQVDYFIFVIVTSSVYRVGCK
jgi:hypothetical protein